MPDQRTVVTGCLMAAFSILSACTSATARRPFASATETTSARLGFASGIPARINPDVVRGRVLYKIYRLAAKQRGPRRLDVCYLQHGYGVVQGLLEFKRLTFDSFVSTYYGSHTIRTLLKRVCGTVIVAMQESNRTTILEMTLRTERFLRRRACPAGRISRPLRAPGRPGSEPLRCAFVGHSKGGAVAFNIARRCMHKTSSLRQAGCMRLLEVYSATGVIQGAMASFVAYGAALEKKAGTAGMLTRALGFGMNLVWDVYEQYVPGKTNPVWVDLNPAAPMEGGRPLAVINAVPLQRGGWLRADFAATGVGYRFGGRGRSEKLFGCGKLVLSSGNLLNYRACRSFGTTVGTLHSRALRRAFHKGLAAMRKDPRFRDPLGTGAAYLRRITWERYQQSDGLADLEGALAACRLGLKVPEARRVVRSCRVFRALNHLATAGGGPAAIHDLVDQLAR